MLNRSLSFWILLCMLPFTMAMAMCKSKNKMTSASPMTQTKPTKTNNGQKVPEKPATPHVLQKEAVPAAQLIGKYLPLLKDKRVAVVANQTSVIRGTHLIDTLLSLGVNVKCAFAPEHGFRGDADAGEKIENDRDPATGLPIYSLHGTTKKPTNQQLNNIDVVVFDIQDVGVRFYTYSSTLHYVMEACAENNIPLVILDRPNPNGHYVDGPVLEKKFQSFVGMHPIPVVHGLTMAELARLINQQGWLRNGIQCDIKPILCDFYKHSQPYTVPIPPSPNLPNNRAIYLYPSLCFFEGTVISVGRGTDKPFQQYGSPNVKGATYTFTPLPNTGAKNPLYNGKKCFGYDLSDKSLGTLHTKKQLDLSYLISCYEKYTDKSAFFNKDNYFDKLAGTDKLRQQIIDGVSIEEIRASWKKDLDNYLKIREKALLYD